MNIFYLDKDFTKCAEYHCDKHIVKMIVEYAQLLSTAHRMLDGYSYVYNYKTKEGNLDDFDMHIRLYSITHPNHPCTLWVQKSHRNYMWLLSLFQACCAEYKKRYQKIHKTSELYKYLMFYPKNIPKGGFTLPPMLMPEHLKGKSVVQSYRRYYLEYKMRFAKWNYSPKPYWV